MDMSLYGKLAAVALICSLTFSGYALTNARGFSMMATPDYDLTIDNLPVNFTDEKTLYLDTQTNNRGFVIYQDHLRIRSQYLTYWDFNESYEHEDVCYVIGQYAYAYVPAENLTLDSITEINRFRLSSWNGTVTVSSSSYSPSRMVLHVNSTENASLLIEAVSLVFASRYHVYYDDNYSHSLVVGASGIIAVNYTGPWSNHTITLSYAGSLTIVPSLYLNIIYVFLTLGVFITVTKTMVLPMRQKSLRPGEVQKNLIKSAIYIVVASTLLCMMTDIFIGG